MVIDIVTLFPDFFAGPFGVSMLERARASGALTLRLVDLRPYGEGPHRQADDYPFGGGAGMVLMAEPIVRAVEDVREERRRQGLRPRVILLSPQGKVFNQQAAIRLAGEDSLVLVSGHYKGVDERARKLVVDEEISLGDFVLTGGEAAAVAVVDAVVRLLPGVLGNEESYQTDSFFEGLLDCPHYTRPREFRGLAVPEVLLSGDHERIRRWRRREALRRTLVRRPDLLAGLSLGVEDARVLEELRSEMETGKTETGKADTASGESCRAAVSVRESRLKGGRNNGTG